MKTVTFELPSDRDVAAAVGEVAIRHGQMEYELKMLVKSLCGITVGVALDATERKIAREVRELIVKLAKRRFGTGPALARLEAFLQRSREASDRRNDLLHGLWATDEDGAPVHRSSGKLRPTPTAPELKTLADCMWSLAEEMDHERQHGYIATAIEATAKGEWTGNRPPPSAPTPPFPQPGSAA